MAGIIRKMRCFGIGDRADTAATRSPLDKDTEAAAEATQGTESTHLTNKSKSNITSTVTTMASTKATLECLPEKLFQLGRNTTVSYAQLYWACAKISQIVYFPERSIKIEEDFCHHVLVSDLKSSKPAKFYAYHDDNKTDSKFSYVVSHEGFMIISFRGSATLKNWIVDFKTQFTDRQLFKDIFHGAAGSESESELGDRPSETDTSAGLNPGSSQSKAAVSHPYRLHKGFEESYRVMEQPIFEAIETAMEESDVDTIILTGHSLGGAQAYIALLLIKNHPKFKNLKVEIVTFGSPKVGDADFVKALQPLILPDSVSSYGRFVNGKDVVASPPDNPENLLEESPDKSLEDNRFLNCLLCSDSRRDRFEKFSHRLNKFQHLGNFQQICETGIYNSDETSRRVMKLTRILKMPKLPQVSSWDHNMLMYLIRLQPLLAPYDTEFNKEVEMVIRSENMKLLRVMLKMRDQRLAFDALMMKRK